MPDGCTDRSIPPSVVSVAFSVATMGKGAAPSSFGGFVRASVANRHLIILSLFLSFTENKNAKRALEERVSMFVVVYNTTSKSLGKKKPLSLSRSREKRFGVWVCVPRVTNFERTVSFVERKMKKWSRNNRTVVGRLKERVVVWWWSRVSINRRKVSRAQNVNVLKF